MWWTSSETVEKWKQKTKIQNGLKKTKCLTVRTGRQKHEQIEKEVKEGKIDEVASYIIYIVTYTV